MESCSRTARIGSSRPTLSASGMAQGPAALTTAPALIAPSSRSTPVTRSRSPVSALTGVRGRNSPPARTNESTNASVVFTGSA